MPKLVTIGIPVYKRLEYLPHALRAVQLQDYPDIELIVSDNGMNGLKIPNMVDTYYSRPYRFRQNATSVSVITHFNQIIDEATGEYFALLSDDDEISSNYVSELVNLLECDPRASIAFSRQEVIDRNGRILSSSKENLPLLMPEADFIRIWCSFELGFRCLLTNMSRTKDIKMCEGYPEFSKGIHSDNALPLILSLNNYVALSQRCTFRFRVHESNLGLSPDYQEYSEASKQFLDFLDSNSKILAFASARPDQWDQIKGYLVKMIWRTYLGRWNGIYRKTLPPVQWIRAGFVLPFIPAYYRAVILTFITTLKSAAFMRAKEHFPRMYKIYQALQ